MPRRIRYDAWARADGRTRRTSDGVTTWTSPWCHPGFRFTDLVASWHATTLGGSWIDVAVQGEGSDRWHDLGAWSSGRRPTRRSSSSSRGDAQVDTDVWRPHAPSGAYRLRVRLHGEGADLHRVGAVVSAGAVRRGTSPPLRQVERVLDVPRLSQMTWKDIGGRGWCSPTSLAMVLSHAGTLPPATDIPAAAAEVFDPAYDGTGNWAFNTAWAAGLTGNAFVTRLRDLRDAERFVDAGIPVVASLAYPSGALPGAPTRGTDGHLVVIRGFTEAGDVVTNDPAAPTEKSVRRTYERSAFERAWLEGSGGVVYVVHRADRSLPTGPWTGIHR